jgi:hypothetical protein
MNKPAGYDDVNIDITEKPTVGGHKCIIVKVIEQKSSTGKEQLEIWLDMAGDDSQPMLFSNQFMANTNENKKWPCRFWITSYETEDFGKRSLKRFVTAAEDSNASFFVQWGPVFADCLKGKRIGVVFGEEENDWNGRIFTLVKPRYFCGILKLDEQPIPEKKTLKPETAAFKPAAGINGQEGFLQVPDGLGDEGLPFM